MHELAFPLRAGLIVLALAFDFLNGLHDAANSIATVVATRLLRPVQAVMFAAFFNFAAYFLSLAFPALHKVAETIGAGLIDKDLVTPADRQSTRLNSSHSCASRMPSSAGKKKTIKSYNHNTLQQILHT